MGQVEWTKSHHLSGHSNSEAQMDDKVKSSLPPSRLVQGVGPSMQMSPLLLSSIRAPGKGSRGSNEALDSSNLFPPLGQGTEVCLPQNWYS